MNSICFKSNFDYEPPSRHNEVLDAFSSNTYRVDTRGDVHSEEHLNCQK